MADLLTAHLRAGMAAPFVRGTCDCCLWACDWVVTLRGIDPAAPLRGRYRTAIGAERHIRRAGGLEPLARTLMDAAGFAVTTTPRAGDLGLVVDAARQHVLAIRLVAGWAAKAKRGIVIEDFPMIVAWSI